MSTNVAAEEPILTNVAVEEPLPIGEMNWPEEDILGLPQTSMMNAITKDPLPFEEVPDVIQPEETERSARSLKNKVGQLTLNKNITEMEREKTIQMLKKRSATNYGGQEPKEVQIDLVIDLIHRRDTFVLAGTGVGKSRIAEMYWDLFPRYKKPIVLVLNPLDALGDNQACCLLCCLFDL
ncbi:uncharacterized protein PGTG_22745 [Puccinia graminis f. sp. tritici CRL 75-36-700-3]|uniref:ATP-dependent DNA helicase sgs1 n=1 Tax=Puccinia graminis f. sp. tritici (strain CRL 75-36-700-3 / race SCCL) TaxID=418459 RepID=H6QVG5_PUCGT|nr:uncharacterized protein PGTG_22745 [Puccinia graminis f. sp. tritici CRL 75-36-700-3]EHS62948.1 hypothetical protein PGTG_22745 [Puccinia graminis f. sp. tritici CRL 75-36-700-3]